MVFAGFVCHKLVMTALLHDSTVIKNCDFVAEPAGGKSVADVNCGLVSDNLIEIRVNFSFRNRVKSGGRLIQYDKRCILV